MQLLYIIKNFKRTEDPLLAHTEVSLPSGQRLLHFSAFIDNSSLSSFSRVYCGLSFVMKVLCSSSLYKTTCHIHHPVPSFSICSLLCS